MTKIGLLLVSSLLVSCAAADRGDETWRMSVSVDGVGLDGDVEFKVPAGEGAEQRARAARLLADLGGGGGGDHEVIVDITAGNEIVGHVSLRAGDDGIPDIMTRTQDFVAGVDGEAQESLICAPIGWCDELPGNCWCVCICGCKCIYWE